MRAVSVALMPIPDGGQLAPETALDYLRGDWADVSGIVRGVAAWSEDAETRDAALCVLSDLETLALAAGEAIANGKAVPVTREDGCGLDAPGNLCALARVATARGVWEHSCGESLERGFAILGAELVRRLEALAREGEAPVRLAAS